MNELEIYLKINGHLNTKLRFQLYLNSLVFCVPFDLDSQINELLLLKFKYMSGQLEHSHKLRFKES